MNVFFEEYHASKIDRTEDQTIVPKKSIKKGKHAI